MIENSNMQEFLHFNKEFIKVSKYLFNLSTFLAEMLCYRDMIDKWIKEKSKEKTRLEPCENTQVKF